MFKEVIVVVLAVAAIVFNITNPSTVRDAFKIPLDLYHFVGNLALNRLTCLLCNILRSLLTVPVILCSSSCSFLFSIDM